MHGTRAQYRRGCHCTPCRAANAAYMGHYRRRKAQGRQLLGSRIPAAKTHIVMRALRAEMSRRQLCLRVGWYANNYARIQHAAWITLRTALKVQREARRAAIVDDSGRIAGVQAAIALEILNGLGKD